MGEENRGSSGSSTAMIVVAILGGLLLVGCCGGIVTVGLGGLLWQQSAPMEVQMQAPDEMPMPVEVAPEVTKALDELNKDLEPLKVLPDDLTEPARSDPGLSKEAPDAAPEPGVELKKE